MEIKSLGRSRLKRVEAIVLTGRHTRQIAAAVSDHDPTAAKEEGDSNRESEGANERGGGQGLRGREAKPRTSRLSERERDRGENVLIAERRRVTADGRA